MARVAIVEGWYGGSHRAWADGWRDCSRHEIEVVGLADRNWRWRMRAGAIELADRFGRWVKRAGRPDAVVVSGIIDVAAFAGLARRALGDAPVVGYMHENQLLYPVEDGRRFDPEPALVNWRSLEAVDEIWFNSQFHRAALVEALPGFLGRFPEPPGADRLARLADKAAVLYPGVDSKGLIEAPRPVREGPPVVLWNQRWDRDKAPQVVFDALAQVAEQGSDFKLILAGEDNYGSPDRDWVRSRLGGRIEHDGWLERDEYLEALARADVVVSAAAHEFFGIAIVEAIAAGATPLLPNRLSFPELIPDEHHGDVLYRDGELVERLAEVLAWPAPAAGLRASMARFDVATSAADHDNAVDRVVERTPDRVR